MTLLSLAFTALPTATALVPVTEDAEYSVFSQDMAALSEALEANGNVSAARNQLQKHLDSGVFEDIPQRQVVAAAFVKLLAAEPGDGQNALFPTEEFATLASMGEADRDNFDMLRGNQHPHDRLIMGAMVNEWQAQADLIEYLVLFPVDRHSSQAASLPALTALVYQTDAFLLHADQKDPFIHHMAALQDMGATPLVAGRLASALVARETLAEAYGVKLDAMDLDVQPRGVLSEADADQLNRRAQANLDLAYIADLPRTWRGRTAMSAYETLTLEATLSTAERAKLRESDRLEALVAAVGESPACRTYGGVQDDPEVWLRGGARREAEHASELLFAWDRPSPDALPVLEGAVLWEDAPTDRLLCNINRRTDLTEATAAGLVLSERTFGSEKPKAFRATLMAAETALAHADRDEPAPDRFWSSEAGNYIARDLTRHAGDMDTPRIEALANFFRYNGKGLLQGEVDPREFGGPEDEDPYRAGLEVSAGAAGGVPSDLAPASAFTAAVGWDSRLVGVAVRGTSGWSGYAPSSEVRPVAYRGLDLELRGWAWRHDLHGIGLVAAIGGHQRVFYIDQQAISEWSAIPSVGARGRVGSGRLGLGIQPSLAYIPQKGQEQGRFAGRLVIEGTFRAF